MKLGKNERKTTFLLITIPILALFICFNTIPLIRGVIYSFTNFKGFGKYDWVGLRNYTDLFSDIREPPCRFPRSGSGRPQCSNNGQIGRAHV